ncbi:hypothetical protein [Pseudomonas sp. GM17]|uniref:hypothetical protein n=1 Tax=Pseudomonas sp. GM17 TaxID=1144323 RepID=UPI0002722B77|nr:hypothetical protein [Pseudomonas sp. GM17]WIE50623.1 hypothetical protein PMI20_003115 [Pseudomonas sp. GM17]
MLSLVALPFYSAAQNEHSSASTEIEFYQIELSPNEKLKLSQLKIYFENEQHNDEGTMDLPVPFPPPDAINEVQDYSLISI